MLLSKLFHNPPRNSHFPITLLKSPFPINCAKIYLHFPEIPVLPEPHPKFTQTSLKSPYSRKSTKKLCSPETAKIYLHFLEISFPKKPCFPRSFAKIYQNFKPSLSNFPKKSYFSKPRISSKIPILHWNSAKIYPWSTKFTHSHSSKSKHVFLTLPMMFIILKRKVSILCIARRLYVYCCMLEVGLLLSLGLVSECLSHMLKMSLRCL